MIAVRKLVIFRQRYNKIMTTQRIYRCEHCLIDYIYYPSGCPYDCEKNNDDRYCPGCKKVINDSLKEIPQKVEKFFNPYNKITLDEVKKAIKKESTTWRRVAMPLYDMQNQSNRNITGFITIDGQEILYSYWTQQDDYRIEIEMERNIETGEEQPWRNIRNRY